MPAGQRVMCKVCSLERRRELYHFPVRTKKLSRFAGFDMMYLRHGSGCGFGMTSNHGIVGMDGGPENAPAGCFQWHWIIEHEVMHVLGKMSVVA